MKWIFAVVLAVCGLLLGEVIHLRFVLLYGVGGALLGFMIDTTIAVTRLARIQGHLVASNNLLVQRLEELTAAMLAPAAAAPEQRGGPLPDAAPSEPEAVPQDIITPQEVIPQAAPLPETAPPVPEPAASNARVASAHPATVISDLIPPPAPVGPGNGWAAKAVDTARTWLLGGNTVLRVGMVVVFLGLAFFLRYAALHLDISLELRYAGVAVFALALLVLGWSLRGRNPGYALALQGLGVAVLYLTTFAALHLHGLIAPEMAFALLVAITLASSVLAVLQNAMGMAVVTAVGGFAAPILTSTGEGNYIVLFSYYALLNTGIFAVAWFKAWRRLNLVGFFATFGVGAFWGVRSYHPEIFWSVEFFLVLFFLMYLGIGLLFTWRRLKEERATPPPRDASPQSLLRWSREQGDVIDGIILFGTPLVGFSLQWGVIHHIEYAVAFSALVMGALYIALAIVFRHFWRTVPVLLLETCLTLGVILATLAVPLALDADWTSAIWAVQAAGMYWLGLRQARPFTRLFALILKGFALVSYLISLGPGTETSLMDGNVVGTLMLAGAFLWTHGILRQVDSGKLMAFEPKILPLLGILGVVMLAFAPAVLWVSQPCAIAWAGIGLAALYAAVRLKDQALLPCGLALQGLAALAHLSTVTTTVSPGAAPLLHVGFLAAAAISLAGFFGGWWLHRASPGETRGTLLPGHPGLEPVSIALVAWGVLWAGWTVNTEALRFVDSVWHAHVVVLVAAALSAVWFVLGLKVNWRSLSGAALTLPAVGLLMIGWGWFSGLEAHGVFFLPDLPFKNVYQPLAHGGWLAWPLAIGGTLAILHRVESRLPKWLPMIAHLLTIWLGVIVGALTVREALMSLFAGYNVWRWLGWAMVPTFYLLAVSYAPTRRWPLSAHGRIYGVTAAVPIAALLLIWFWSATLLSDGAAPPLPYLPFFNPLELGLALALGTGLIWVRHIRRAFGLLMEDSQKQWVDVVAVTSAFLFVTWGVFRAAHQWASLPFDLDDLLESQIVQAALSIAWTFVALTFMIAGHAKKVRAAWMIGAALMGVVTLKLFFVELRNTDGIERAISFVGVGLLMLVVGYFAPLPPRRQSTNESII